jgi:beta-lactam-binding protein with PASTA domain
MTLADATSALTATGFARGTVSYVTDSTCNNIGLVKTQSPSAGTAAAAGTLVNLSIGKLPTTPCP